MSTAQQLEIDNRQFANQEPGIKGHDGLLIPDPSLLTIKPVLLAQDRLGEMELVAISEV